ncbi:MAG: hypothetical protein A2Z91_00895 [Deltaproteobacteria bacterium GWA2_38_16]|nr:MAG: hypothetical protein A2Z91_00895 [Deltaproteobacteria bacterium GWA2_38_16]OGQ03654.1 MAG: hypothetical protein A3D19_02300 [Deltaproteobacteria bacterium RIFCSPHIGHO2_02_FULL_38_15]OGQ33986.1 MAG: hypothetical protein A3A72_04290 [Deltaproteobacteria bacterium RIFCSPLOWO2_01_FULL_38_9]OGQ60880.1 MAG: hypothetical protein A3G92_07915 [Deltaproteobacteria bacterium RIFCSPLOWO2_12_FULL_38_8]HBQ21824.1 hypothetical protein [Deltaproteobacteria bacterium]
MFAGYIAIAGGVGFITILGGVLSLKIKTDQSVRYWIALASGLLISTAFFEMLPEIKGNFIFVALGFFLIYVLDKMILIHACGEYECKVHHITWPTLLSTGVDNFIDGMAIASGYLISPMTAFIIAGAVAIHESIQSFTAVIIMKNDRYPRWKLFSTMMLFGITIPIGALLFGTYLSQYINTLLAFSAGVFLYVGASDMLPEAHVKFNIGVVGCVILGALLVPLLHFFLGA